MMYTLYMKIPITKNQWAVVDADDYDDIMAYHWTVSWQGSHGLTQYVYEYHPKSRATTISTRLHRLIMNVGKSDKRVVHHINGDTLDNRKCNLMIMSVLEHCSLPRKKNMEWSSPVATVGKIVNDER